MKHVRLKVRILAVKNSITETNNERTGTLRG